MRIHWIGLAVVVAVVNMMPSPGFSQTLYQTAFDPPTYVQGLLPGQDGWFAALGADAALVSTNIPVQGARGVAVRVEGALLEEFFGYHVGSYARPLFYDPIPSGTPRVELSALINLSNAEPDCGMGIGLSGILAGDFFTNIQIGVRREAGGNIAYISNADGIDATGPSYVSGEWASVRASFDFATRTATGYFNEQLFGVVPFTDGMSNDIYYLNAFLSSAEPIPNAIGYFDDLSLTAAAVPEPSTFGFMSAGLICILAHRKWREMRKDRSKS